MAEIMNLQSVKEFLKPNWIKIIVFGILIVLSFIPNLHFFWPISIHEAHGWPYPFYYCTYTIPPQLVCQFELQWLFIDLLGLYILSCLVIWIYDKVKKK